MIDPVTVKPVLCIILKIILGIFLGLLLIKLFYMVLVRLIEGRNSFKLPIFDFDPDLIKIENQIHKLKKRVKKLYYDYRKLREEKMEEIKVLKLLNDSNLEQLSELEKRVLTQEEEKTRLQMETYLNEFFNNLPIFIVTDNTKNTKNKKIEEIIEHKLNESFLIIKTRDFLNIRRELDEVEFYNSISYFFNKKDKFKIKLYNLSNYNFGLDGYYYANIDVEVLNKNTKETE